MALLQIHGNIGELQPIVENSIRSNMSQPWHVICSLTIVAEWDVYVFFSRTHLLPCNRNRGVYFWLQTGGWSRQSRFWILALERYHIFFFKRHNLRKNHHESVGCLRYKWLFALFYKGLFKRQDTGSVVGIEFLVESPFTTSQDRFGCFYSWDTPMPIHTSTFWGVPIKS